MNNGPVHDIHRLVLVHGREAAREMVPERQRPLVDIAAEVLADETLAMGISYAGFCLTSLIARSMRPRNEITSCC